MDKDRSIITQVAAKIASELTGTTTGMNAEETVNRFTLIFVEVKDVLMDSIYGETANVEAATQTLESAFGEVKQVESAPTSGFNISVRGQQHGDIPNWLLADCRKAGVSEVFDNRDGLSANPKRPWFKATTGDKAFWPPKGK